MPAKPRFQHFEPRHHGKGPNGRRLCVWCGTEVPPGKRRWCSDDCVHAMQTEHWPGVWKAEVLKRDHRICRLCGFDDRLVDRVLNNLKWDYFENHYHDHDHMEAHTMVKRHLESLGFKIGQSLVEADHTVPIVEGGSNTPDNGRTLCQLCHRAETARLARRRKHTRRAKKASGFWFMREDGP